MIRVIVQPAAERDIGDATNYYEAEAELGQAFLDEIGRSLDRLRVMQQRFPEIRPGVRRTIMSRFPYAIYFKVQSDVLVLAVLHMKRSPTTVTARTR